MQIIPAIDLKDNKCVRLKEGKDETSFVFNDDPKKQALYFEKIGCKKIHIVDLDAAFGRPEINISSIKKIRKSVSIPIQLGGGIRSETQAAQYFNLGINNIIIGSMSVNEPETVKLLSEKYDNQIYVSLDIKKDNVMIKGWKEKSKIENPNRISGIGYGESLVRIKDISIKVSAEEHQKERRVEFEVNNFQ